MRDGRGLLLRSLLPAALVASWGVMTWEMWRALHTMPSPERLKERRLVEIPTPPDFFFRAGLSLVIVLALVALLWPWWRRRLALRLAVGGVGMLAWFLMTVPIGLSTMEWLYRRWLFFVALGLLACAAAVAIGTRMGRGRRFLGRTEV